MTDATRKGARAKAKAPARAAVPAKKPKPLTPFQAWSADADAAITSLCEHVTAGGHMADYARAHSLAYVTLLDWVNDKRQPQRAEMYARAREERADKLADEIVAIADEVDVAARYEGEDVTLALDATAIARNRLRVDARKWVAAKLKPRVYADKTQTEVTGPGGGPLQHSLAVRFVAGEAVGVKTAPQSAPDSRDTKDRG